LAGHKTTWRSGAGDREDPAAAIASVVDEGVILETTAGLAISQNPIWGSCILAADKKIRASGLNGGGLYGVGR
jgi:hypothetical protein